LASACGDARLLDLMSLAARVDLLEKIQKLSGAMTLVAIAYYEAYVSSR